MRSNLGVGMPIDMLVVRRDTCEAELSYRIEPGEPYFHDLRERWSAALRQAHMNIPRPPYGTRTLSAANYRGAARMLLYLPLAIARDLPLFGHRAVPHILIKPFTSTAPKVARRQT